MISKGFGLFSGLGNGKLPQVSKRMISLSYRRLCWACDLYHISKPLHAVIMADCSGKKFTSLISGCWERNANQ